jgi:DNA-binding CsgD family transcriptional regulator
MHSRRLNKDTTMSRREPQPGSIARMRIRDACAALADQFGFTARERDLLFVLACGTTSAPDLAARLMLRPNTIHNHLKGMFRRAMVGSKSELLALLLHFEVELAERRERFQNSTPILLLPGCEQLTQPLTDLGLRIQRSTASSEFELGGAKADVVVAPWTSAERAQRLRENSQATFGRACLCLFVSDDHELVASSRAGRDAPLPMQAHRVGFEVLLHRAEGPHERSRLLRIDCDLAAVVDDRLQTSLWNVGFDGAFVRMPAAYFQGNARLRTGDALRLSVALPDESTVDLRADVVWTRQAERPAWPSGAGVRFTVASDDHFARLHEVVRMGRLGLLPPSVPALKRQTDTDVSSPPIWTD